MTLPIMTVLGVSAINHPGFRTAAARLWKRTERVGAQREPFPYLADERRAVSTACGADKRRLQESRSIEKRRAFSSLSLS